MGSVTQINQTNVDLLKRNFVWVVIIILAISVFRLYQDQRSLQADFITMQKDVINKNTEAFLKYTDAVNQSTEAIRYFGKEKKNEN